MYSLERKFVLTANDQMQILENIWGAGPQENTNAEALQNTLGQKRTITALHSIKFAANSVQARGVYRAANFCETICSSIDGEGGPRLRGSLAGLKNLIFQYADGLFEIDPEFKASILTRKEPLETESKIVSTGAEHNDNLGAICLQAKHEQAQKVLKPLLLLVKSENSHQALETLMAIDLRKDETPAAAPTPVVPQRISVKFENLMRPITNLVLSEARHSGKQVSISYAADFDELGLSMANRVQEFLEILCLNIVANGVPANQSTQISLTGQDKEKEHTFSVNWRGYDVEENTKKHAHLKRGVESLRREGGDIKFRKLALETVSKEQEGPQAFTQHVDITFLRKRAPKNELKTVHMPKSEKIIGASQGATG